MSFVLTPRNYYNFECAAVPDNKIQQVVGTYTERSYSEIIDAQQILEVDDMRNGRPNPQALPPFSNDDLASSSTFTGVFTRLEVYGDGFGDPEGSRLEKIVVKVTTDIYGDEPMTYLSANTSEGAGIQRTRTANQGTQWVTSIGWASNFDAASDRTYAIRNYNASGGYPSTKNERGLSDQQLEITNAVVDSTYDGTKILGGKYLLRVTHSIVVFMADFECYITYDRSDPGNPKVSSVEAFVDFKQFSEFKLNITYGTWTTKETAFDYHVSDAGYSQYPLKITGNEYTSDGTVYNKTMWREYIANQLLSNYQLGKLWVTLKVKASYMIQRDIGIDTELRIKDLDGQFITKTYRPDEACVFKVKNIEYSYSGSEFIAHLCLLEVSAVSIQRVVDSQNNYVVDSNNNKLKFIKEEL